MQLEFASNVVTVIATTPHRRKMGYVGVVVSGLSAFVLGGFWYSPAGFLNQWKREETRSGRDLAKLEAQYASNGGGHGGAAWVVAMLAAVVASYALDGHLRAAGAVGFSAGATHGAWLGATLVATSFAINYAFGAKTAGLLAVDATYHVAQLALAGGLLAGPLRGW